MPNDATEYGARRILIVDDDGDFADSLVDLLARQGYESRVAIRPEAALAALEWEDLAVVMLDVRLGGVSGVDLLSRLKIARPDLIFVMMTAHINTQTAIKALRHGAYDYCDKACEPSEIFAVLERCFEKRQLANERRDAYKALQIAKDEAEAARALAEAANRAKSEFLATMSHELRTPLNAVIGFSQVMINETLGPIGSPRYREYAKDIQYSGTHLLEIINDILDLSKAEAGKLEPDESRIDIREVVSGICRLIRPRAEQAGLSIVAKTPENLPDLWADERQIKQILLNLVGNAVKFTPAGGRVEIATSFHAETGFAVTVQDTGIGIAAADLQRVLEPFVQVENSLTRRHEGSGLGLAVAAKLAQLHGGSLSIDSDLGKGTRVTLRLLPDRALGRIAAVSAASRS
jgi:signal transduction histidine kinase